MKEVEYGRQIATGLGCEVIERTDAFDESVDMGKDAVVEWLMLDVAPKLRGAHFVVVVCGGHGSSGALCTTDHKDLDEPHDIERPINTAVKGVPKFFFYQHCMGTKSHRTEAPPEADAVADAAAPPSPHKYANTWRFYSSTTGFYAYRSKGDSPFLKAVSSVIDRSSRLTIEQLKFGINEEFANHHDQVPHCDASLDCRSDTIFKRRKSKGNIVPVD